MGVDMARERQRGQARDAPQGPLPQKVTSQPVLGLRASRALGQMREPRLREGCALLLCWDGLGQSARGSGQLHHASSAGERLHGLAPCATSGVQRSDIEVLGRREQPLMRCCRRYRSCEGQPKSPGGTRAVGSDALLRGAALGPVGVAAGDQRGA